ncbi:MAG: hypothetical protein KDA52_19200 [Planctomycetaceae bacterium]|nr:hypothetical protein [Planctomycetaceae bacterium]
MADYSTSDNRAWRITLGLALLVPVLLMLVRAAGTVEFRAWVWSEQGPLEFSHVLIPLLAVGMGVTFLWSHRRSLTETRNELRWLTLAIAGLTLMCFAIAGEEASWGQHLIGWSTPEGWAEVNDQQETNLHNIGSWADQKPRAIVELSVLVFGILWPVWHLLTSREIRTKWAILLPPMTVLPITIGAELSRMLETIPKLMGTSTPSAFPRPSELQEYYFYTFFALCMWTWRQRLLSCLTAAEEAQVMIPVPHREQSDRLAA